jgi:hypothetical protein
MPSPSANKLANASLFLGLGGWAAFVLQGCFDLTLGLILTLATAGAGAFCSTILDFLPFFLWLAGVVSGHAALGQVRHTGEAGRGRAIAGLVLAYSGLFSVMFLIVILLALVAAGIKTGWLGRIVPAFH